MRDKHEQESKQISKIRKASSQIAAVSVKNILLLGYGMTLGFPTILIPKLSGNVPGEKIILGDEGKSWIGSIHLITVPLGCLLSGYMTHAIGRRSTMQLLNIPFVISWLLFYFSAEVWHIYLALAITGLVGGLLEAPVITYVAEVTEPNIRGILCTTSTLAINAGILWTFICGTFLPWRYVVLVNCSIPVLSFISLMFIPESPYWLIGKNRLADAKRSIAWLRGWTTLEKVEDEYLHLCKHLGVTFVLNNENNVSNDKLSTISSNNEYTAQEFVPVAKKLSTKDSLKLFTKKSFIWPFLTVSFGLFLSHFGGSSNIQTYAVEIFAALNTPIDKYYATILIGVVQLFGVATTMILISFLGKRTINFIALLGCATCFLIVSVYCNLKGILSLHHPSSLDVDKYSWLPMTLIITTSFLGNASVKMLPWILMSEIFSSDVKPTATGMSSAVGYTLGFLSNKCFLSLVGAISLPGIMGFYTGVCILGFVVLYFILPETEGKSLFEISDHYAGRRKLDNKVYKKTKDGEKQISCEEGVYKQTESRF